jgi:hypothetical protein
MASEEKDSEAVEPHRIPSKMGANAHIFPFFAYMGATQGWYRCRLALGVSQ